MSGSLRVAIVGGGIGGLAVANAFRQRGAEVAVYEQAGALGEVGAGVFMSPNSLINLRRLGLGAHLDSVFTKIGDGSQYYRMDGTRVGPILTEDSVGNPVSALHRADLLATLASGLPGDVIHTGFRCVAFEQTADVARLTFANGQSAEADVVVAADGVHSVLQKYVVETSKPTHSGSVAYRGLIEREKVPEWRREVSQLWMGQGKHVLVYPVRRGELINYVAFVPTTQHNVESWSAVGDRDELAASFVGWDPAVTMLLERVESCFWWGLYDREPLARWTKGRLALLGDAAHAMLPHLGQGANQSIEDGIALAVMLEGLSRNNNVPDALRRYEEFRRPRTDIVQREARQNGHRYDSNYENLEQRDQEIATSAKFRKWLYDYDVTAAAQAFVRQGDPAVLR